MNIIIPMAGRGTRLRPHTIVTPKPLISLAGKPIVHRIVQDIAAMCPEKVEHIGFVIGDFGKDAEEQLLEIAKNLGAQGHIYYQTEALGTAHAVMCAKELLYDKVVVAFADTVFKANFRIDTEQDGIIYVHRVEDPSAFGVVQLNEEGVIKEFIEKPAEFVSDLAIIGIYYFKDGKAIRAEMQHLLDNDIKEKGEYQLTNALENMKAKGAQFKTGAVEEWLDCGNKDNTVYTNQRILEFNREQLSAVVAKNIHSVIIPPCYFGENVSLENAVIGPHVSVEAGTQIKNSRVSNSIIQSDSQVENSIIENSMIGKNVTINGKSAELSLGDYSNI